MSRKSVFSPVMFSLVLTFFYMPLLILIVFSFNDSKTMSWSGFSLRWYQELFFNSRSLWNSFLNSLIVAASSATLSTIIGTLGAIGIYWYNFRFKRILQAATFLPLILPEIIIGVSLLIFFAGIKLHLACLPSFWPTLLSTFHLFSSGYGETGV